MPRRLSPRSITVPAPLIVNPSQRFEVDLEGASTFTVQVGSPPQSFRVIPSTSSSETWVVAPEGCTTSDPSDCAQLRGAEAFNGRASSGFSYSASSTWTEVGIYTLDLDQRLGDTGNGLFGTDVVGLNGGNSSGGISLANQVVSAIADKSHFMGYLGLSNRPTSFTSSGQAKASLLQSLKYDNLIPSLSYGFTAGASYEGKGSFANLVLGGYDQSRFKPSPISFSFASSDASALEVGVQSIVGSNTLKGVASLTQDGGHLSLIDSAAPHIWLPRAVCDQFEQAFGLTYDNNTDLYLINDTMHTRVKALSPQLTFKIGNTAFDDGNSTNIVLPYAAFDKQVGWPTYINKQNYFPIRRAANDSQLTLGRTFLQEAYLIVDYERRNFTLNQATFSEPLPSSHIIAIPAASSISSTSSRSSLGIAAIVGIIVGFVVASLALLAFAFWFVRRHKTRKRQRQDPPGTADQKVAPDIEQPPSYEGYSHDKTDKAGHYTTGVAEVHGSSHVSELHSAHLPTSAKSNLFASSLATELPAGVSMFSSDGQTGNFYPSQPTELSARASMTVSSGKDSYPYQSQASELPSPAPVFEMMGDSSFHGFTTGSSPLRPNTPGMSRAPDTPGAPSPLSAGEGIVSLGFSPKTVSPSTDVRLFTPATGVGPEMGRDDVPLLELRPELPVHRR